MDLTPLIPDMIKELKSAAKLIEEAHDTHIYNNGDTHPADCEYCKQISDINEILLKADQLPDAYRCGNCDFLSTADFMPDAKDIGIRMTPGETYTDKECPLCHMLAFPVEKGQ